MKMSLYPRVTEKRKTMDGMPVLQKELDGEMTRFVVLLLLRGTIVYTWPCGCLRQKYVEAFSWKSTFCSVILLWYMRSISHCVYEKTFVSYTLLLENRAAKIRRSRWRTSVNRVSILVVGGPASRVVLWQWNYSVHTDLALFYMIIKF